MGSRSFCMALALPRDSEGNAAEHVRVAIASVDGTVRVVNGFNPDSVVAVFATRKDAPISAMAVAPIQNRDAIIAGVAPVQPPSTALHGDPVQVPVFGFLVHAVFVPRHLYSQICNAEKEKKKEIS
jgi:hypothetical protein